MEFTVIICIGDSVTFGVPVHLNPPEKTFSKQLESLIGKRFGQDKVEVLNAGNPAYTSYQGLKQLKTRLLKYNPDLLIIQFGINDSSPAVGQTDKEQSTRSGAVLSVYNALSKSAVCCAIVKWLRRNPKNAIPSNGEVQRVPPADFKKNMLMIMALGRRNADRHGAYRRGSDPGGNENPYRGGPPVNPSNRP